MTENDLRLLVQDSGYYITRGGIMGGDYMDLFQSGDLALSICEFGSLRSEGVARYLTDHNLQPTLFLAGGLRGVDRENVAFEQAVDRINLVATVLVILAQNDELRCAGQLMRLEHYQLFEDKAAVYTHYRDLLD